MNPVRKSMNIIKSENKKFLCIESCFGGTVYLVNFLTG